MVTLYNSLRPALVVCASASDNADVMPAAPTANSPEDLDSACLRAVADGDREAFRGMVERWQDRLVNYFYRSTGNRSDAEDLAQETFLDLYRAAPKYESRGNFSAFVFTLARRRLIDAYRQRSRKPLEFVDPGESFMQLQSVRQDASAEIEEAFHRALSELSPNQRNAILLLQQQALSYEEISDVMDCSVSAVKTWLHRARQHLKRCLADFRA